MDRRKFIKNAGLVGIGTILTSCKTIDNYIIATMTNYSKRKDKEEIKWIESLSEYGHLSDSHIIGKYGETEIPMERKGFGVVVNNRYISMGHIYAPTVMTPFGEMELELKERKTYLKDRLLEEIIVKFEKDENGVWEDIAVFKVPEGKKNIDIGEFAEIKEFPCPVSTEYKLGDRVAMIGNPWLDGWNYRIGRITDVDGHSNFKNNFSISTHIASGDSGTSVVNLENRTLIGLATYQQNTLAFVKGMESFKPYIEKDEEYFSQFHTGTLGWRRTPKTAYEKIKLPQEKDRLVLRP